MAVFPGSQATFRALMERSFAKLEVLAVYIDGIQIGGYHVLAAVGLDDTGKKHLLGLARGASENARVVKDLLDSLVKRGIDASRQRLFVIDRGKALRSGIEEVYGVQALVQRCRIHKLRNVLERLPDPLRMQVRSVMHAAYNLPEKDGRPSPGGQSGCPRAPRRGGEPAGGVAGDLHGQSPATHTGTHSLPCQHQHHRESERWSAARVRPRHALARSGHGVRWATAAFLEAEKKPSTAGTPPKKPEKLS